MHKASKIYFPPKLTLSKRVYEQIRNNILSGKIRTLDQMVRERNFYYHWATDEVLM